MFFWKTTKKKRCFQATFSRRGVSSKTDGRTSIPASQGVFQIPKNACRRRSVLLRMLCSQYLYLLVWGANGLGASEDDRLRVEAPDTETETAVYSIKKTLWLPSLACGYTLCIGHDECFSILRAPTEGIKDCRHETETGDLVYSARWHRAVWVRTG